MSVVDRCGMASSPGIQTGGWPSLRARIVDGPDGGCRRSNEPRTVCGAHAEIHEHISVCACVGAVRDWSCKPRAGVAIYDNNTSKERAEAQGGRSRDSRHSLGPQAERSSVADVST